MLLLVCHLLQHELKLITPAALKFVNLIIVVVHVISICVNMCI